MHKILSLARLPVPTLPHWTVDFSTAQGKVYHNKNKNQLLFYFLFSYFSAVLFSFFIILVVQDCSGLEITFLIYPFLINIPNFSRSYCVFNLNVYAYHVYILNTDHQQR